MNGTLFDISQPKNAKVLNFLSSHRMEYSYLFKQNSAIFAPWNSVPDADSSCGCHPDIVGYLWDVIGAVLPVDCRGLVYGIPALVHHNSGIIFAIGIGTICCIRPPGSLGTEAINAGAKTYIKLNSGGSIDVQSELGEDWVFGPITPIELTWGKRIYEMFDYTA